MLFKNHARSEFSPHRNWKSFSDLKVHMKYELYYYNKYDFSSSDL